MRPITRAQWFNIFLSDCVSSWLCNVHDEQLPYATNKSSLTSRWAQHARSHVGIIIIAYIYSNIQQHIWCDHRNSVYYVCREISLAFVCARSCAKWSRWQTHKRCRRPPKHQHQHQAALVLFDSHVVHFITCLAQSNSLSRNRNIAHSIRGVRVTTCLLHNSLVCVCRISGVPHPNQIGVIVLCR